MAASIAPRQPGSAEVGEQEPATEVRTMVASAGDVEGVDVSEPMPTTHVDGSSDSGATAFPPPSTPLRREMDPLADTDPTTIHQYELVGRAWS